MYLKGIHYTQYLHHTNQLDIYFVISCKNILPVDTLYHM